MRWAIAFLAACGRVGFDRVTDASGPVADASGSGASATVGCVAGETPGPFHTDFSAGDPTWGTPYNDGTGTLAFVSGEMRVSPADSAPSETYGGIYSPNADFHERRLFVEVPTMVNPATGAIAGIGIETGARGQTYTGLSEQSGELSAEIDDGSDEMSMVPYDPVAQLWIQVSEHVGTVSFETSPDGVTWTVIAQKPTPSYYGSAYVDVFAGTDTSQTGNLGTAVFDNLFDCLLP